MNVKKSVKISIKDFFNFNLWSLLFSLIALGISGRSCQQSEIQAERLSRNACIDETRGLPHQLENSYSSLFKSLALYNSRKISSYETRLRQDWLRVKFELSNIESSLKKFSCKNSKFEMLRTKHATLFNLVESVLEADKPVSLESAIFTIYASDFTDVVRSCCD